MEQSVLDRSNPSAQHQLFCMVIEEFPEVTAEFARLAGFEVPEYDEITAGPATYPMPDGSTVHGDTAVQFRKGGTPVFFAQTEMQRRYTFDKLATLRTYHGAEVRRSRCAGVIFTISPEESEARKFQENDALYREELAFRAAYQSGTDLAPLADPGRPLSERVAAVAAADLRKHGVPSGTVSLMLQLRDIGKERVADQLSRSILEECSDISQLEEEVTDAAMDRLMTLPSFRDYIVKRNAESAAKAEVQSKLKTLADVLVDYFSAQGDTPSAVALKAIRACDDPAILNSWLHRAYNGETSAQIFEA